MTPIFPLHVFVTFLSEISVSYQLFSHDAAHCYLVHIRYYMHGSQLGPLQLLHEPESKYYLAWVLTTARGRLLENLSAGFLAQPVQNPSHQRLVNSYSIEEYDSDPTLDLEVQEQIWEHWGQSDISHCVEIALCSSKVLQVLEKNPRRSKLMLIMFGINSSTYVG